MFRILIVVGCSVLLAGCLMSDNPLPESGKPHAGPLLIGYWTRPVEIDGRQMHEVLTVFPSGKKAKGLAVINSVGRVFEPRRVNAAQDTPDTDVYDFHLSTVEDTTFVNLLERDGNNLKYIIMKYVHNGDRLDLWNVSDDFLIKTVKKHPEWFSDEESQYLGLSEKTLMRFFASLTDADYDEPISYVRWRNGTKALREMVESE